MCGPNSNHSHDSDMDNEMDFVILPDGNIKVVTGSFSDRTLHVQAEDLMRALPEAGIEIVSTEPRRHTHTHTHDHAHEHAHLGGGRK